MFGPAHITGFTGSMYSCEKNGVSVEKAVGYRRPATELSGNLPVFRFPARKQICCGVGWFGHE
jgi:hypothetical protein